MRYKQSKEELSNVSLLIYLLVHFPQIFTINYNLLRGKIVLSFMLKVNIEHEAYIGFKKRFYECVGAYCEILKLAGVPRLKRKIIKSWTLLQVTFRRKSITMEEVNLVSSLILKQFKTDLIIETRSGSGLDMEKTNKEEFIEYLLSRKKQSEENLLAFREAGKVYVFDK